MSDAATDNLSRRNTINLIFAEEAHTAHPRSMIVPASLICSFGVIERFLEDLFANLHICHFLFMFDLDARAIDMHYVNRKICGIISFTKRII